ncbi:nicotinate-nucleotide adenylyltransferase [Anaeromicropila herbilytica]|uniref:Probable nicotinate-nucleotide adenylyltransferase n=1 Tax=Anaeromicropila herbilytica TaxID=2785025 RepID=A0A7R7ELI7_9FIRM|nr:nicotinate-nucleotide adenylyltransferase [Anaeromicropila herbilytica]BCN30707.1 putative nicotinate-nucleotide adenylyltransferase [Anaeromicropila herbilytica]
MRQKRKVGIMGGTFNPIHTAHLILAEQAYEQFQLDTVLFMPSKNPPHKNRRDVLPDSVRQEMVLLAIQHNPHFELSTVELDREGITYTADTLTCLKEIHPDWDIHFIIGADSLYQIDMWKNPDIVMSMAKILAATRYAISDDKMNNRIKELHDNFNADISLLHVPNMDISSEYIRKCLQNHKSIKYYVSKEVEDYIMKNNLYHL